jgi:hypothetical protein
MLQPTDVLGAMNDASWWASAQSSARSFLAENWGWLGLNVVVPIFLPPVAQLIALAAAWADGAPKTRKTALCLPTAFKDGQLIWVDIALIVAAFAESPAQRSDGDNGILCLLALFGLGCAIIFGMVAGKKPVPYPKKPPRGLKLMWLTFLTTFLIVFFSTALHVREKKEESHSPNPNPKCLIKKVFTNNANAVYCICEPQAAPAEG